LKKYQHQQLTRQGKDGKTNRQRLTSTYQDQQLNLDRDMQVQHSGENNHAQQASQHASPQPKNLESANKAHPTTCSGRCAESDQYY
jgi:hypothetical protein